MQTKKEMWWLFYYIYTENDNESKKTFFRLIDKILKKQKKNILVESVLVPSMTNSILFKPWTFEIVGWNI